MNIKHNQSSEDYLESILMLSAEKAVVHRIDVAKRMNVSQPAVNKAMKILVDKQYIYEATRGEDGRIGFQCYLPQRTAIILKKI